MTAAARTVPRVGHQAARAWVLRERSVHGLPTPMQGIVESFDRTGHASGDHLLDAIGWRWHLQSARSRSLSARRIQREGGMD
jgi:hypothetical protein